jgi:hypothetical protein
MTEIEAMAPESTMKRPSKYDDAIVRAAAEKLAVRCAEWEGEAEDWIDDLVKCRRDWDDGYQLARALETRCSVSPDGDLVETLDDAYSLLVSEHERAVKQWVQIVGFTPRFQTGDRAECRQGPGIINSVKLDEAIYYFIPDSEPNKERFKLGGGYLINAEDMREPAA